MRFRPLILLLAIVMTGCGASAGERVGGETKDVRELTLLTPIGDRYELVPFTQAVERESGGTLRIRVVGPRHDAEKDFEAATIRDVREGGADLGWASARAWDEFDVPAMRALVAPLLIDSYGLQEQVLREVGPKLLPGLERAGVVGVGMLPGALRVPIGYGRALVSADASAAPGSASSSPRSRRPPCVRWARSRSRCPPTRPGSKASTASSTGFWPSTRTALTGRGPGS